MLNKKYIYPIFFVGLMLATYLGFGEYFILAFGVCLGLCCLKNKPNLKEIVKLDGFKCFIGYYVIISTIGLINNYVNLKDYLELGLKYILIPLIIFFSIPRKESQRISMLTILKGIIFISAIYGFIESAIKYNYMSNIVQIESRAWMETMNGATNYQPCSFFLHYNYYGCVLILGLILGKYLPYKNKLINLAYWSIVLEQILVCQSRICWVATVVVLLIEISQIAIQILQGKKEIRDVKFKILIILGVFFCILIIRPSFFSNLIEFISDRFSRLWVYGLEDGSLGQRVGTLMNWFPYFSKNIIIGIFGSGYNSIINGFMTEYSYFSGYSTADCQLTVYLVETGIIGVLIISFAIIEFLKQKTSLSPDRSLISKIGKIGIIAYIVESFTLDIVSNNIVLSLIVLMILIVNKEDPIEEDVKDHKQLLNSILQENNEMKESNTSKNIYYILNQSLEQQNQEYQDLLNTKEYKTGSFMCRLVRRIKELNWRSIRGYFRNRRWNKTVSSQKDEYIRKERRKFVENDYFSNEKIAVYTCVFGKYDQLQEPVFQPDNIDYYIISDQEIPENSLWKPIPWEEYCLSSLSNVDKNRFFKMHPDVLFPQYKYSIYIDGNIKIISDLTPYIKLLGNNGIGFHYHNQRQCAYKELNAIQLAYKANKNIVNSYAGYLKKHNFPYDYGLLECNVIVREHNNPICKKVMSEWWKQFQEHIKRDQVSLPYVLFKNNIKVDDIAVLGVDVYKNPSFRIAQHI